MFSLAVWRLLCKSGLLSRKFKVVIMFVCNSWCHATLSSGIREIYEEKTNDNWHVPRYSTVSHTKALITTLSKGGCRGWNG